MTRRGGITSSSLTNVAMSFGVATVVTMAYIGIIAFTEYLVMDMGIKNMVHGMLNPVLICILFAFFAGVSLCIIDGIKCGDTT